MNGPFQMVNGKQNTKTEAPLKCNCNLRATAYFLCFTSKMVSVLAFRKKKKHGFPLFFPLFTSFQPHLGKLSSYAMKLNIPSCVNWSLRIEQITPKTNFFRVRGEIIGFSTCLAIKGQALIKI